ncbi:MAG TPA: DUF4326 domain-containing protein [Candidatus Acidoferrales bacterium]|nr:DUF4326 domain-containing protein [Candidatus Acidoferrales bacterium]
MLADQAFDHEASMLLARRVRAQNRRCWRNAALAVSHLGNGARYVEGWIVSAGVKPHVIEHGWCEIEGRVVDPTYAPHVTPDEPPAGYFAGMRFSVREAEAAVQRRLPISWTREEPGYWRAFEAAWIEATRRGAIDRQPLTRVVHCRQEAFDVFIGRPTEWANPFHIGRDGNRNQVVVKYCRHIVRSPGLLREVWTLRGKALGCRCAPLPCHGDVLAALANVDDDPNAAPLARWLPTR